MSLSVEDRLVRRRLASNRYKATLKGRQARLRSRYKAWETHRDQMLAHSAVRYAIKIGKLTRPALCSKNDTTCYGRVEGHHNDYSKKLDVKWFCIKHHTDCHMELR